MAIAKEPVRQESIVSHLRERIIRGALPPGSRLPTRLAMAEEFDTTVVTVQRALTRLSGDGFVTASGSRGTFVSKNPPHLSRYGLIFPFRQKPRDPWSLFLQALFEAAMRIEHPQSCRLSIYYNVEHDIHRTDDYDQLVRDIESRRLAGLIFAQHPFPFGESPVNTFPGLPRVALMGNFWHNFADAVSADRTSFFDRALDHLHARGRRRVAVIGGGFTPDDKERIAAGAAARRMIHRPHWLQSVNVNEPQWAANVVQLLLHNKQTERPDALIIADDNIVEHASAGIIASGVRVPQDLDVVAHCNYPHFPPRVLPIRLLGFDCERLLRTCIEHIDRIRQGETPPRVEHVPAQFEEELVSNGSRERSPHQEAALAND